MGSLNFCSCTTWFLDLDDLVRINRAWLYKDLKVSDLQANACLAHLVRHWTPRPVIISSTRLSLTGGNIFLLLLNSLMPIMSFLPKLYKLWKTRTGVQKMVSINISSRISNALTLLALLLATFTTGLIFCETIKTVKHDIIITDSRV